MIFFAYGFWWEQISSCKGRTLNPSTDQGKLQKDFGLSNNMSTRADDENRFEFVIAAADLVARGVCAWGCCFDRGKLKFGVFFFHDGKAGLALEFGDPQNCKS